MKISNNVAEIFGNMSTLVNEASAISGIAVTKNTFRFKNKSNGLVVTMTCDSSSNLMLEQTMSIKPILLAPNSKLIIDESELDMTTDEFETIMKSTLIQYRNQNDIHDFKYTSETVYDENGNFIEHNQTKVIMLTNEQSKAAIEQNEKRINYFLNGN